jgi:hypothetical protein
LHDRSFHNGDFILLKKRAPPDGLACNSRDEGRKLLAEETMIPSPTSQNMTSSITSVPTKRVSMSGRHSSFQHQHFNHGMVNNHRSGDVPVDDIVFNSSFDRGEPVSPPLPRPSFAAHNCVLRPTESSGLYDYDVDAADYVDKPRRADDADYDCWRYMTWTDVGSAIDNLLFWVFLVITVASTVTVLLLFSY